MAPPRGIGDLIVGMLDQGLTHRQIVRALDCSKSTVSHHAKTVASRTRGRRPTYDWQAIQAFYDGGQDLNACKQQFGFSRAAWIRAIQPGKLRTRDWRIPVSTLLNADRVTQRTHLKMRLLSATLLRNECYECGLVTWRDKPLALELDHTNGNKRDNRLENLRMLCPNCHSQTSTYAGRNKGMRPPTPKISPSRFEPWSGSPLVVAFWFSGSDQSWLGGILNREPRRPVPVACRGVSASRSVARLPAGSRDSVDNRCRGRRALAVTNPVARTASAPSSISATDARRPQCSASRLRA